jgi:hypothetical protein
MAVTINASTSAGLVQTADTSGVLQLQTANTNAVTVDASQNVGIGTAAPAGKLEVNATSGAQQLVLNDSASTGNGNKTVTLAAFKSGVGYHNFLINGFDLRFAIGGSVTEAMRIDSSGNVLVGTTASLSGATGNSEFKGSVTGGGAGVLSAYNSATSGADGSPPLTIYKGMTTTTSSARFIQFYANVNATPMGGIVGNGASNVQFAALSDARDKTNIQPINGSLDKVLALKPSSFDWIADNSHVNAGFIAQEVQTVFPEFVVDNMANEGQPQRFGLTGGMTGGIIPHLVKAIQEQQTIINDLKARIETLEGAA